MQESTGVQQQDISFFFIIIITFGQKKMKYVLEAKGEMTILRRCNHRFLEIKEKKEKE